MRSPQKSQRKLAIKVGKKNALYKYKEKHLSNRGLGIIIKKPQSFDVSVNTNNTVKKMILLLSGT